MPSMNKVIAAQITKEAERINAQNMTLVQMIETELDLPNLVFMDLVQESELPQDNMTYVIIENGDYNNVVQDQKKFLTETVTITFWSENRPNPTLDRLQLIFIAKQLKLHVQSSQNENVILTDTSRVINMFTLTCTRGVKIQGVC